MRDDCRMPIENHEVEVAPDELRQPHGGAVIPLEHSCMRGARDRADGDRPEPQMHRKVRSAIGARRIVASLAIAIDPL